MAIRSRDFLIVSKEILPEAILKTLQAKELIAKGEVSTVNEAVNYVGISRSAYYKYKDGVYPFYEASKEKIITISMILENIAGVLSHVLNFIASAKANILTINQGIPVQGIAYVSISFDTTSIEGTPENLLNSLSEINGVRKIEIIAQS